VLCLKVSRISGNFQKIWKLSKSFGNFPEILESFQILLTVSKKIKFWNFLGNFGSFKMSDLLEKQG
jgi:hypothetical protein